MYSLNNLVGWQSEWIGTIVYGRASVCHLAIQEQYLTNLQPVQRGSSSPFIIQLPQTLDESTSDSESGSGD